MGVLCDWFGMRCDDKQTREVARARADPAVLAKKLEDAALAARAAAALAADSKLARRLEKSADMLEGMADKINKGIKIKATYEDVKGIYVAWNELDKDTVRNNPKKAAKAFGKLFKHAGGIAEYLPPPANAYAEFLAGFEDFFSNMQDKLDPESPNTPRGRAMREALDAQ